MNFTKEYIKECDCKEIQGLDEAYECGNHYYIDDGQVWAGEYPSGVDSGCFILGHKEKEGHFSDRTWLPTGDQLDDEIVKICEEGTYYEFYYDKSYGYEANFVSDDNKRYSHVNTNPLIAKIKLLKVLFKEHHDT